MKCASTSTRWTRTEQMLFNRIFFYFFHFVELFPNIIICDTENWINICSCRNQTRNDARKKSAFVCVCLFHFQHQEHWNRRQKHEASKRRGRNGFFLFLSLSHSRSVCVYLRASKATTRIHLFVHWNRADGLNVNKHKRKLNFLK